MSQLTFENYRPTELSLHDAVVEGLSARPKQIPPKFFYDQRGSQLFEQICQQPEYYLPDVERQLLDHHAGEIARLVGAGRVVIEPGAGSAEKIRLLLHALQPRAYVPMDISAEFLQLSATQLVDDYPGLRVHASCVDFTHSLPISDVVPDGPRMVFFPGSSLGNFEPDDALRFLRLIRQTLGDDGVLLIGVDTKKQHGILDAAYNDAAGVTSEFNLNLLHRIQNELSAECDPEQFRHHAFYNSEAGRIEMHLISRREQEIRVNGFRFPFAEGESVHTESSYKYSPMEFSAMATAAGFVTQRHWLDTDQLFAVYLLRAIDSD